MLKVSKSRPGIINEAGGVVRVGRGEAGEAESLGRKYPQTPASGRTKLQGRERVARMLTEGNLSRSSDIRKINSKKAKSITGDQEKRFELMRQSIHQGHGTMLRFYVPNKIASKYIKQKLPKKQRKTDKSAIIMGDFNISSQ